MKSEDQKDTLLRAPPNFLGWCRGQATVRRLSTDRRLFSLPAPLVLQVAILTSGPLDGVGG